MLSGLYKVNFKYIAMDLCYPTLPFSEIFLVARTFVRYLQIKTRKTYCCRYRWFQLVSFNLEDDTRLYFSCDINIYGKGRYRVFCLLIFFVYKLRLPGESTLLLTYIVATGYILSITQMCSVKLIVYVLSTIKYFEK